LLPGIAIEVLAHAESTNTVLLDRVRGDHARGASASYGRRAHDLEPCLLVAEHQTQGRGRMGRSWQSGSRGSLTFSLGMPLDLNDWSGLSLAVGTAIADALDPQPAEGGTPRLQIKWPNDLWLDGRKLGGILIETVSAGAQRMVVIGVGLNVSELTSSIKAPSDFAALSPNASATFSTGFAALEELLPNPSAPAVLAQVAPAIAQALVDFQASGFDANARAAFARRDLTLNRHITAGSLDGMARGVNAQGELLVQTGAGVVQAVSGGEVSVRLAVSPSASAASSVPH
jgi:BirA family biotin operon repressor/biotin-[acetyl-CoA-carboxylase] ligase